MEKTLIRLGGAFIVAILALAATSLNFGPRLAIAILIGLPSFISMIISRRQLGESFSVMPEARTLVTTGLYSKIQHPMYLFLDLFIIALIILLDWPVIILLWLILVIFQTLQSLREEKVLAAAFGTEYDKYRNQTWF